jgi:phage gp29-like protein
VGLRPHDGLQEVWQSSEEFDPDIGDSTDAIQTGFAHVELGFVFEDVRVFPSTGTSLAADPGGSGCFV